MGLKAEIFEQPAILGNLLDKQMSTVQEIARRIRERDLQYVFLAARGTSDHAGLYAKYLWGAMNGLPIALAAPSLFTLYHEPPVLKGALVVGVSQSGQSPDIVSVLAEGQRQGCPTLAISNDPRSPLSKTAEFVIEIHAGTETAVAATKTYTAQLMAIAMLSAALNQAADQYQALEKVPGWIESVLTLDELIAQIARRYCFMERCVVLGRGFNYSTAFEWSLKMKELTYVLAEPYSSADFQHGPMAIVEHGFPVMAVAPDGKVYEGMLDLLRRMAKEKAADLVMISDQEEALSLAKSPIQLPHGIPEWLTPIVSIVPAQLFAYYLTLEKGYNTETPRSIQKVTETE